MKFNISKEHQMQFVNLTPHAITVEGLGTIPASGQVARVSVAQRDMGTRGGIRLRQSVKGMVEGIPAPVDGVTYIVSGMVLDALAGSRMADVVAPDTGADAIRKDGQIVAVRGFLF
jgi:hypothetical protein